MELQQVDFPIEIPLSRKTGRQEQQRRHQHLVLVSSSWGGRRCEKKFVRKLVTNRFCIFVVSTLAPEPVDPGFTGFLWLRKIDHVEVFLGSSKENISSQSLAYGSLDQSCQSLKETKQLTADSLWKGGTSHLQLYIFEGTKYFFERCMLFYTPRGSKK